MDKSKLTDYDREMIDREPDREFFESHGFICEVTRHPSMFTLCGYVFIPKDHPMSGADGDVVALEAHGGITYSDYRGEYWVVGFDCNHLGDYSPGMASMGMGISNGDIYRRWDWVKAETEHLASQIAAVGESTVSPDVLAKFILTVE